MTDDQAEVVLLDAPETDDDRVNEIIATVIDGLSGSVDGHVDAIDTAQKSLAQLLADAEK